MLTFHPEVMPPAHTLPFPSAAASDGPAASLATVSRKDARTIPLGLLLALDPHARFAADGVAVRRGQTVQEFAAERLRWIERCAPQSTSSDAPAPPTPTQPVPTAPAETGDMLDPIETLLGRLNVDDEPDELVIARVTGVRGGLGGLGGTRRGGW